MKNNPSKKIMLAVLVIFIIGAAFAVGKFLILPRLRPSDPRVAVLKALSNMTGDIQPPELSLYSLYKDITAAKHSQDITLGVNGLGGTALGAANPRMLSGLEMLTLNDSALYDPVGKKRIDALTVSFAVTPLARLNLYTDPSLMSVSAPQAFDYAVTVDPQRVTEEWDGSILGTYLGKIDGIILAEPFYEYYSRLLFPEVKPKKTTLFDYEKYGAILDAGAEYAYAEKTAEGADGYRVTLTADALNNLLSALMEDFAPARFPEDYYGRAVNRMLDEVSAFKFTESVSLFAEIKEERITAVGLDSSDPETRRGLYEANRVVFNSGVLNDINGQFQMEPYSVSFSLLSKPDSPEELGVTGSVNVTGDGGAQVLSADWTVYWNRAETAAENLKVVVDMKLPESGDSFLLAVNGNLLADAESQIIDARLDELNISAATGEENIEAQLSLGVTLRPSTEAVAPEENARQLASVNELDVLGMYARLREDPDVGPLLQEYIVSTTPSD